MQTSTPLPRATEQPRPPANRRPTPLSAKLILAALFIDLAATKSGSYIGIPGVPVFLPDILLAVGAGLAVRWLPAVSRSGLVVSAALLLFALAQLLRPSAGTLLLAVRDVAPYLYLALVPFVALALRGVHPGVFVRCVRAAVLVLAASLALRLAGVLDPIEVPFAGVPLFSPRDDAEAVVLGIGLVAFGRWEGIARPSRLLQATMLVLAFLSYSRAGLLAVLFCFAIGAVREAELWARPRVLQVLASVTAVLCLSVMSLVLIGLENTPITPPQALQRLLSTDTSVGTTGARIAAWQLMLEHAEVNGTTALGAGPGTEPVADSGAVAYLSGDLTVRAAHNWAVSAIAYFGTIGLGLWTAAVLVFLSRLWRAPLRSLAVAAVGAYGVAAALGVIVESPFGSLPIAVMLAWLVANRHGTRVQPGPDRSVAPAT
jgi:hypothetical protein